jgi:hypothetical protein
MKNTGSMTIYLLGALLSASMLVSAQDTTMVDAYMTPGYISPPADQIEKSAEGPGPEKDYTELGDDLMENALKPVNLNAAKEEELNRIPFLTPGHRKNLLNYLITYGEVLSVYELQSIAGFDSVLIRKISPFIIISHVSQVPSPTPRNLFRFGRHELLVRFEQQFPGSQAYVSDDSARAIDPDSYYPGSPQRYYFRYNFSWLGKIRIGIAGEKDPGEQFFRGAQSKGMDFYTAFLCLNNIGILRNLVIGNFRVSWGQGLTMGSGISLAPAPGFSTPVAMATGIRPASGMNEVSYLRGLAATLKIKGVEISGFASCHPRDATVTLTDSASSQAGEISSFTGTGYHRTRLELAKRDVIDELVCGANISFSMAPSEQLGFKIGLTGLFYKYSIAINPAVHPYNRYVFRGSQNLNTGFDFQVRYHGVYFFGELSRSLSKGIALLAGTTITPDPRVCINLIYRNYQAGYQNLYANAFGQNSLNANERGIYAAIDATIHARLRLSGYIDIFSFPWLKYRVDTPTHGKEFGLMLVCQASEKTVINFRFYQKNTRSNLTAEEVRNLHRLTENVTRDYRCGIEWVPGSSIMLKTRIELREAGEAFTKNPFGYLVYQEAQIKAFKFLETITCRFALFDVPDYASRIYVYEPEVLYGYSVPAYQGNGMRTCLMLKFGIARRADLWIRGGLTYYTDRMEIGTGPDLTKGNVRVELTGQLLIRL